MNRIHTPLLVLAISLGLTITYAPAQEPTNEQLQSQYDEALKQLQAAQDRKNELANENELLKRQIESLTEIVNASHGQSLFLQTHYNLWQMYVAAFPEIGRWFEMSVGANGLVGSNYPHTFEIADLNWPFSAMHANTTAIAR